jgi:hypothetical protein
MTENHLEDLCFDWLAEVGYECLLDGIEEYVHKTTPAKSDT